MDQQLATKTILIIDDQSEFRRIYGNRLASDDRQVLSAGSGALGLEIMHKKHIDIVLLDLLMPDMSGEEVLRAMQADPALKDIPVIIFSIFDQRPKLDELRSLGVQNELIGAKAFLVKGLATPNEVLAEIAKLIGPTSKLV
jgi:CheY-like chemotaxis protein